MFRQFDLVMKAALQGRAAHFLIFHGAAAAARRQAFLRLAALLNCENEAEPGCGHCLACRKIKNNNHPDIYFLEPEGKSIGVAPIADLRAGLQRERYEGKYSAALIDKADKMTLEASNALLRLAEEPPPATVLVLSADNGETIISTLRSRAQMVFFPADPDNAGLEEEALALAGGDAALAAEISLGGGAERVGQWLTRYEAALAARDFLPVLALTAELKQDEVRLLLLAFAARLRRETVAGRARPAEMALVKKALDDLRYNVSQRLVLEVLTLRILAAPAAKE